MSGVAKLALYFIINKKYGKFTSYCKKMKVHIFTDAHLPHNQNSSI